MLVKVNIKDLKDSLGRIFSIVDKRSSRPILTNILITAENSRLVFVATDLEVSAKISIEANVENKGNFCVNAKNIFDITKELPNEELILKTEDNVLTLNCGKINYTLLVTKENNFPKIEFNSEYDRFEIEPSILLSIINKTSYAISDDDTRLFLNGTFLQTIDTGIRAVATDGYKLALLDTKINLSNISTLKEGVIVPKKGIYELKKIVEFSQDIPLKVSIDESFMYINSNNCYNLAIRLISRNYPNYHNVIPSKTVHTLRVSKKKFLDATKRVKVMSDERSNTIKVTLENNEVEITAINPILGEATEKFSVDYTGEKFTIGFNAKYLIDTLNSLEDGDVVLKFNNELSPLVVKSSANSNFLGIVMPLKLTF